jgi:hypothetical protein
MAHPGSITSSKINSLQMANHIPYSHSPNSMVANIRLWMSLTHLSAGQDAGAGNQHDSGRFGPNTFQSAGAHVCLHPYEVDGLSRASRPAAVSTARPQIQGPSNQQTYPYPHGQGLQYPPHMAYHVTPDQGSLLPGIECGVADPMLQALILRHSNTQHQVAHKHFTRLSLSRGCRALYRPRNLPLLLPRNLPPSSSPSPCPRRIPAPSPLCQKRPSMANAL